MGDKPVWADWRKRVRDWKKDNKYTDADIAAALAEQPYGISVGRSAVQAWLAGRNDPKVSEFFAMCAVIGADPGHILFEMPVLREAVTGTAKKAISSSPTASPGHAKLMKKLGEFKKKRRALRRVIVRS